MEGRKETELCLIQENWQQSIFSEYAFYTAVADNKSVRDLMGKDELRELAIVLTKRVKQNASIDWTIIH